MSEKTADKHAEKHAEKSAEKQSAKLILFNHSKNPFTLKDGPNKEKRTLKVGQSIECLDQTEYDQLRKYRGVGTTAQVSPDLGRYVVDLESQVTSLKEEIADLKKQLGKDKKG